jgi:predicted dithiol-disulfide oxidoreductase (DUF899 family)
MPCLVRAAVVTHLCHARKGAARNAEFAPPHHTHSAYARGLDGLWGMYQWLDRAPRGRNETGDQIPWFRRHDEYHSA